MVCITVSVQPADVPITVNVVVAAGVAFGLAQVLQLNEADGDHAYVVAPLAVSITLPLVQMVSLFGDKVTETVGVGLTVMVTVFTAKHPPIAVPPAVIVVELPLPQISVLPLTVTVGVLTTVTVEVVLSDPALLVTTILVVYV